MREILFRGKRIDNGEWIEGAYFSIKHNDDDSHLHHVIMPIPVLEHPNQGIFHEVDPETVGQFTGLYDKHSIWIFKGDILHQDGCWSIFVLWDEQQASWGYLCTDWVVTQGKICKLTGLDTKYMKVIGTIHDEVT